MQKKKNHLTGGFLKNTLYMRLGRFFCLVENTRLELVTSCMPCKPIPIRYNILTSSIIAAYKHTSPQ